MSTNKKAARRALYSEARKYLDIKSLFPKSEIDWRNLSDYQARKISEEFRHLVGVAGGLGYLKKDFVKVRRTKGARKYIGDAMLPKSARGILLPGGAKMNSNVSIRNGGVFYSRGLSSQAAFPLDALTAASLEKSIRQHADYIRNPDNLSYIGTAGGKITGVNILKNRGQWLRQSIGGIDAYEYEEDEHGEIHGGEYNNPVDAINSVALSLFHRYAAMADNGEFRKKTAYQIKHNLPARLAASPSKWGMSLIVEAKQF